MTLKRIPLEGALVDELILFGTGKDCCVRFKTTEPDYALHFDVRDPDFRVDLEGKVRCAVFSDGSDTELGVRYRPLEPLRLSLFTVDFPGSDRDWRKVLKRIREGHPDAFDWMLSSVALTIVPASLSSVREKADPSAVFDLGRSSGSDVARGKGSMLGDPLSDRRRKYSS